MKYHTDLRLLAESNVNKQIHLTVQQKTIKNSYPVHCHDYFEIEFVYEGNGVQLLNGVRYNISRGSFYMLNPADFHSISTDNEIKLYTIAFDDSMLTDKYLCMLLCEKNIVFTLAEEELPIVIKLADIIDREQNHIKQHCKEFAHNLLECLFITILRHLPNDDKQYHLDFTPVSKVITYLNIHFRENPSLSQAAKIAGMSPCYFSEIFSHFTGKSYVNYLTALKLNCAKTLLCSENMPITEICFACGFTSIPNFIRAFKKDSGVSPRDYRKIYAYRL